MAINMYLALAVATSVVLNLSPPGPEDSPETLAEKAANAKYPYDAEPLYRALFAKAGAAGLPELQRSPIDSVAIQAAWEEVTLTVPVQQAEGGAYRPDQDRLQWFLGFLEGRGRVTAPQWWNEVVLDARANRRDNIYSGEPKASPYHRAGVEWVTAPLDTTVTQDGDGYMLTIGEDSIRLPEELLQLTDHDELYGSYSGCFTPEHCFVAAHESVGYLHDVACIDRATGKVVWNSEACGCWWGGSTGQHTSGVSVTVQDDRVVVFGEASIGFYAHVFRADDGATVFRFSSGF